jgi:hypothetical protein
MARIGVGKALGQLCCFFEVPFEFKSLDDAILLFQIVDLFPGIGTPKIAIGNWR